MYNDLLLERIAAVPTDVEGDRIDRLIDELEALENLLSPEAQQLIRELRPHTVSENVYEDIEERASFGARLADRMSEFAGSWPFILFFVGLMAAWIVVNTLLGDQALDPAPFILLNLGLSTLAGLQAPVILMAQNRQAEKDRAIAQNDFEVNLKNEVEIADLHRKIDGLYEALAMQTKLVNALVNARRQELVATLNVVNGARRITD